MPLTRGYGDIVATMNGVRFVMLDGLVEIACRAESSMLREIYGSDGEGNGDVAAFRNYQSAIEKAASEKYDAGNTANGEVRIIIARDDVASHLSLKFGRR